MSTTSDDCSPIPLSVPCLQGREWDYVRECLDTGWVSSAGPFVERFEKQVAEYVGVKHAVAVVNGTSALHTALLCAGVRPDDEVLVPTLTFIAPANSIHYAGAHPVFIDAEPRHWQMDPNLVEQFLTRDCERIHGALRNRTTGRMVRAILPVHILGHPADMDPICELAQRFELQVIEDAAEGMGTRYNNRHVGQFGDIGCFSFNGNKIITTGGGGMIVTDDERLAARARHLSTVAKDDALEYIHGEVGYNYRMTNIAAALGCAQLEQLDQFVAAKRRTAETYQRILSEVDGVQVFAAAESAFCTYWLMTIAVSADVYGIDWRSLHARFAEQGIQTRPLWQPLHASGAHRKAQAILNGVADRLYDQCLSLPCSVDLPAAAIARVCTVIERQADEQPPTSVAAA